MPCERVLILGGTSLAREAANALVVQGCHVITSLAGVTRAPHLPQGEIRRGGFGGVEGLVHYLRAQAFDVVIDATHPFAAQMSDHAAKACAETANRLMRLEPEAWHRTPGDVWRDVVSIADAVAAIPPQARVAVTVGRKEIAAFTSRSDIAGVARMIEPPDVALPSSWHLLLERPPFTLESEMALLRSHAISCLVSKNAGGARVPKLEAAAALNIPVIMVARPQKPPVEVVTTVAELLGRLGLQG